MVSFESILQNFIFLFKNILLICSLLPYSSENKHPVIRSFYSNFFIRHIPFIILFVTYILINNYLSRVAYFRRNTVLGIASLPWLLLGIASLPLLLLGIASLP